jgi:aminoglycoside phosphotransferase family enzyme/predicted kinase
VAQAVSQQGTVSKGGWALPMDSCAQTNTSFDAFVAALSRPEAFTPPVRLPITIIQTHASVVLLAGSLVYKLKKPKNFGFFDYTTPQQRRHFCLEEVRLNARLAPQVYLGVAPVLVSSGKRPTFGRICGPGELPQPGALVSGKSVIDYAVVMVRLPEEATLEARLHRHEADELLLSAVAGQVAEFHKSIQTGDHIAHYGELETIRGNWEENFQQMYPYIGRALDRETYDAIVGYARDFMGYREPFFAARRRDGYIRDCHGDLRLQHIYCLDYPLEKAAGRDHPAIDIIDCIEFNERFRYGDVASEVAFLTMELEEANRPDLAQAFSSAYVAVSGDEALPELLPFYCCYRACVRGKVLAFQLDEPEVPAPQKESAQQHARALFDLALRYTKNPTKPVLLMIGGMMGTGKTSLAESLRQTLGWKVLASDTVRKRLAGSAPAEPHADAFETGLYTAEWTARTYTALLQEATAVLADARSVILDASFSQRSVRQSAAALAASTGARPVFVECRCSREVALQRLARRWKARTEAERSRQSTSLPAQASDGRPELYDAQRATWQPVTTKEGQALEHRVISTGGAPGVAVGQLLAVLLASPAPRSS